MNQQIIGTGTALGLIEYLDQLIEKGRATKGSIKPLKTAVRQVLSTVEGEEHWKDVNIRDIDTDDYISRFKNIALTKYNEASYVAYLSRLNKAKKWYVMSLQNPGWIPSNSISSLKKVSKVANTLITKTETNNFIDAEKVDIDKTAAFETTINFNQKDLVSYPFPLRTGKMVYLYLPTDLTSIETKRLNKFVESLSIDGQD